MNGSPVRDLAIANGISAQTSTGLAAIADPPPAAAEVGAVAAGADVVGGVGADEAVEAELEDALDWTVTAGDADDPPEWHPVRTSSASPVNDEASAARAGADMSSPMRGR
jgi:hypothetical protein